MHFASLGFDATYNTWLVAAAKETHRNRAKLIPSQTCYYLTVNKIFLLSD